jgi:hypothetical protein
MITVSWVARRDDSDVEQIRPKLSRAEHETMEL